MRSVLPRPGALEANAPLPGTRDLIVRLSAMIDDALRREEEQARRADELARRAEEQARRLEKLAARLRQLEIGRDEETE